VAGGGGGHARVDDDEKRPVFCVVDGDQQVVLAEDVHFARPTPHKREGGLPSRICGETAGNCTFSFLQK
jgi:hypothetical protein